MTTMTETRVEEPSIIFLPAPEHATSSCSKPSILLVFFPGGLVDPERYVRLCRAIQSTTTSEANVHIGIGRFTKNFPGMIKEETASNIDAIRKAAAKHQNEEISKVKFDAAFVAGHSMGGYEALPAGLPLSFDGVVLLGSTCNSIASFPPPAPSRSIASYPKPVLTAVGNRDGFMRLWHLANEMNVLDRYADEANFDQERREQMLLDKPVVSLDEINHMQLADGVVSPQTASTGRSDLESAITLEEGWRRSAEVVADFILYHSTGSKNRRQSLLDQSRGGREAMASYRKLSSPAFVHSFAESMQKELIGLEGEDDKVRVCAHFHDTKEDFLYSKPSVKIDSDSDKTLINIHIMAQDSITPNPTTKPAQLTPTLAIKFKSREGVLEQSNNLAQTVGDKAVSLPSFADMNRRTFDEVLQKHVTQQQKERYLKDGRQLEFLPDLLLTEPPEWVEAPMEVTCNSECTTTYVRSPYVITSPTKLPEKFAGMLYGKPLSPAQAYEYIVFDAFKKHASPSSAS